MEAELWIKHKLESFESDNYQYSVSFQEEIMLIHQEISFSWSNRISTKDFIIPLKKISNVSFKTQMKRDIENDTATNDPSFIYFYIECDDKCFEIEEDINQFGPINSRISLSLDLSILEDDMINRLIKALNHLIGLNGGSVVKDVF